jgi:hypothetical protein
MKKLIPIVCVLFLFGCEDYLDFLSNVNQPPVVRLVNSSGGLVTELSESLKLPSDFKQDRPEFFTIRGNAVDPEGLLDGVRAVTKSGNGTFSEINVNSNGSFEFTYTPEPGDLSNHIIDVIGTDNLGNASVSTLTLEVFINKLPTASFTIRKVGEISPYEYILDAKQSTDPDQAAGGGITKLEWTIGGVKYVDPMINSEGVFVGGLETKYIFPAPGNYTITLVTIDNDGGRSPQTTNQSFTIN